MSLQMPMMFHSSRSMDFLAKAFELFPGVNFCVITVPHLVPEFPLLQQFVVSNICYPVIIPGGKVCGAKIGLPVIDRP